MKPLMLFGVMYLVFTEFVRIGTAVKHYPVVLLSGIVMYTFFAEATAGAVGSVVDRENLVRKIHFPRLVIPLAMVLTTYLNFLLNFVAVVVFALASGVELRLSWLEIVPLALFLGAFCTGIAMLLSAYFVRFRDIRPIWDVVLPATFYATPVLYPLETIPSATAQHLVMCNPLAVVVEQTRHALVDPTAPSAAQAIGGAPRLLIPFGIVVLACAVGFWVFNREAPRIAEEL
jgi:ABC-2 type transport system permease protein